MKNTFLKELILSIFAGISISLGCMIYLMIENKIIGAVFFSVGLFLVLTRKYNLYTGKVANILENKFSYIFNLINIWFGNLIGCAIMAGLTKCTKLSSLTEKAIQISENKISQSYLSAFVMAMFCGIIIYLAVDNFNKNEYPIGKYFGLVFLIPLFIICGFEHCVANMYYIILAEEFSLGALLFTLNVTIGNAAGSIIYKLFEKITKT